MRRRKNNEVGLNLDSLLDTLTNVIGFLIILLILMQLGVDQAVERIRELDPSAFVITEAEVSEAEARAKQRSEEVAQMKQRAAELAEEMALLEDPKEAAPEVMPLPEARKLLAEVKSQTDQKEKEQKVKQAEVARLKERMGKTPRAAAPAPHEIRMPDPRAAPPGTTAMWVMCRDKRATMIDIDAARAAIKKELANPRTSQALLHASSQNSAASAPGAASAKGAVFDPDKLMAYFRRNPVRNRDYAVSVRTFDNRSSANMEIAMLPNGGEDIARIKRDASKFRRALKLANEKKKYIRFLVYPDSFEAYLTARSITDEAGVAAGWEIYRSDTWQVGLGGDVKVFQKKKPPPRPKTVKKPPATKKKTPPPRVID
jgi:hypothetical protein